VAKKLARKSTAKRTTKRAGRSPCVLPTNAPPVGRKAGESDQSVIPKADIKKIQELLKLKTAKGVKLGLSLLESLSATTADYQAVFTEPVIRAITWDAQAVLATAKHLLPHLDTCTRFIGTIAEWFCKATEPQRLRLLHELFRQPFCYDAWHADPAKHRLDLDMSDGTVLWDVLHRELLAAQRVKTQYRDSESPCKAFVVHSLNGIHLAGYYYDRDEGRPGNLPNHVVQACNDWRSVDQLDWVEVAWAVSFENMIGMLLHETTSIWDAHDWGCGRWDKDPHVIIVMLWSWFTAECLNGKEIARLDEWHCRESTPIQKRKTLFRWTDKGERAVASYAASLLRQRKFRKPRCVGNDVAWPGSPYLPWQNSGSWGNEFEARFRRGKKEYASYATLSDEHKYLACYAAMAVRDAAQRIKPLTEGEPVIEGLANHTLICLALHPATPQSLVQMLAHDAYEPVASAATAGRGAKSDQLSPADKMKDIVDYVVRGTGGRARTDKVSDDTSAIAKRLSRYWSHWKQEDSDDVDAVNTEEPRTNENRMRAVAMGVAVARGWIVPTKEGISLMRTSVADLDAPPSNLSNDDDDND
jgi:hypothetical protein